MRPTLSELGEYDGTRADGVQDAQGDRLPARARDGLHLRDRRHSPLRDRRGGGARSRSRSAQLFDLQPGVRAARDAQAVPGRLDPHRLPAHGDGGPRRRDPVPRARAGRGPRAAHPPALAGRGLLPRGLRHRPPHHLPHRPAGHAADRGGHRARPAHAPASCRPAARLLARVARATRQGAPRGRARPARTSTSRWPAAAASRSRASTTTAACRGWCTSRRSASSTCCASAPSCSGAGSRPRRLTCRRTRPALGGVAAGRGRHGRCCATATSRPCARRWSGARRSARCGCPGFGGTARPTAPSPA